MPKATKTGFYAVARGRVPGVYTTWDDCLQQVSGFAGNKHQKFSTPQQANSYLAQHGVTVADTPVSTSTSTLPPPPSKAPASGSKPYRRPVTHATSSRWAALTSEIIEDESGWDVVYSDGACKGNGKVGSLAGVGVWWGENDARNIAERCPGAQTNNRAELIAIVRVLETSPHTKRPLLIKTDSKYSISCFREWMPKWLRTNFVSTSGQPVKNASLIRYLSALLNQRARKGQKVHLQYVKGHAGEEGNEGADRLANLGALTMAEVPEREWNALIDVIDGVSSELLQARTVAVPTVEISQEDLEAFAAGLADDDELLAEVNGKS